MADISAEVKKFREAIYGEEVRESMSRVAAQEYAQDKAEWEEEDG